jgi:hypothetical protein
MTAAERVPDHIRRFVLQRLATVAELEALLLVRSAPERAWCARDVADRLYIGEPHAHAVLEALRSHELAARRGEGVVYQPASAALRHEVEALAVLYPRLLIPITELIHAQCREAGFAADAGAAGQLPSGNPATGPAASPRTPPRPPGRRR